MLLCEQNIPLMKVNILISYVQEVSCKCQKCRGHIPLKDCWKFHNVCHSSIGRVSCHKLAERSLLDAYLVKEVSSSFLTIV